MDTLESLMNTPTAGYWSVKPPASPLDERFPEMDQKVECPECKVTGWARMLGAAGFEHGGQITYALECGHTVLWQVPQRRFLVLAG